MYLRENAEDLDNLDLVKNRIELSELIGKIEIE